MTERDERSDAPAEIVSDDLLGGQPRLAGHRIGVIHVWVQHRQGKTIEEIADAVYPHLRVEQVEAAVEYARSHPETMRALERERERKANERRRRARERKQVALGEPCPECGDTLVDGGGLPLALVRCEFCGEEHAVTSIVTEDPS